MPEAVVASFNLHSGVDGWGRPYDVVDACRRLDADVLVLLESWVPAGGAGLAEGVAVALGYELFTRSIRSGRLVTAHPDPGPGWKPRYAHLDGPKLARTDHGGDPDSPVPATTTVAPGAVATGDAALGARVRTGGRPRASRRWPDGAPSERGAWHVSVLSRLAVAEATWIDLGQLRRDPARRGAWRVVLGDGGHPFVLVATHAAHLLQGSPRQLRRLRASLPPPGAPGAVAGDMNAWTPVMRVLFPGWRPAVRGATWPAWRPHSQIDHIFVNPAVEVAGSAVLPAAGSDHLPVRATLRWS